MKKILILLFSGALMSPVAYADLNKCAQFVIGMQSDEIMVSQEVEELTEMIGFNKDEFAECRNHIELQSNELKLIVADLLPDGLYDDK